MALNAQIQQLMADAEASGMSLRNLVKEVKVAADQRETDAIETRIGTLPLPNLPAADALTVARYLSTREDAVAPIDQILSRLAVAVKTKDQPLLWKTIYAVVKWARAQYPHLDGAFDV